MNRTAVFETNQGIIKIELFEETMPITTGNFIKLAEDGFYDGIKFHRIIRNFMIQGGDPLTKKDNMKQFWGTGGPGYTIKDEFTDNNRNDRGTISMANAGPNTGGSQFFINLVNNNFLDDKHPAFGKVTEGMNIVDKIAKVSTDSQDKPLDDVVIEKVSIE
ncbi:MAG: peptidylprolyl isomerase [archaeon]|nr:peptidylprolyl isomerase [archaeon]